MKQNMNILYMFFKCSSSVFCTLVPVHLVAILQRKAIARDNKSTCKLISVDSQESADELANVLKLLNCNTDSLKMTHLGNLPAFEAAECSLSMGRAMSDRLWRRRLHGERAYSIVGLTHSLISAGTTGSFQKLVTDPVQPWDAMICTSLAGRSAVVNIIDAYRDYLERRGISASFPPLQLPVIPLGIHIEDFANTKASGWQRKVFRERLGIGKSDVAVLSFGRIDPFNKSHPVPLLQAMQRAQTLLSDKIRLHLVLVGQTPHSDVDEDLRLMISDFANDFTVHLVDGSDHDQSCQSWHAADMFVSLADNVQETFGLTPVEAMAAGLPVIVSDWDGYRDTVDHESVGIRVPTVMPSGDDSIGIYFSERHAANIDGHTIHFGSIAQLVAVDVKLASAAIAALARDPQRRKKMGRAARKHVASRYDWSIVMDQYHELIDELSQIRAASAEIGIRDRNTETAMVDIPDAFRIFKSFPTHGTSIGSHVAIGVIEDDKLVDLLFSRRVTSIVNEALLPAKEVKSLLGQVRAGNISIQSLCGKFPGFHQNQVLSTCLWLTKYGLLTILADDV